MKFVESILQSGSACCFSGLAVVVFGSLIITRPSVLIHSSRLSTELTMAISIELWEDSVLVDLFDKEGDAKSKLCGISILLIFLFLSSSCSVISAVWAISCSSSKLTIFSKVWFRWTFYTWEKRNVKYETLTGLSNSVPITSTTNGHLKSLMDWDWSFWSMVTLSSGVDDANNIWTKFPGSLR